MTGVQTCALPIWLTLRQAQALLNAPDITTTQGLRDHAIIAVLLAVRKAEVVR